MIKGAITMGEPHPDDDDSVSAKMKRIIAMVRAVMPGRSMEWMRDKTLRSDTVDEFDGIMVTPIMATGEAMIVADQNTHRHEVY